MKKIFTIFFVFATFIACAQESNSYVTQALPQGSSQVTYTFTVLDSEFYTTTDGSYKMIKSNQSDAFNTQVGAPQLPVYIKKMVLPPGSIVTNIQIENQNETLINSDILLFPTQPPNDWKTIIPFVAPNQTIYNSSNSFPVNTVVKVGDESSQGYRIVSLEICPFKYIPNQKKLSFYRNIDIKIQYSIGQNEYQEKISKFRSDLNKDWISSNVENPQFINSIINTAKKTIITPISTDKMVLNWKPSAYGDIPDYIIITNEKLKPFFKTLADYKIKRGIPTLLVTTEQIYSNYSGIDNAEKIRNYLKAAYNNWGAGLFILLGGDTDVIPARIASYDGPEKNPSDLYYSDVYKPNMTFGQNYNWNANGNEVFGEYADGLELGGDNYLGRAPVDTPEEAENFVKKIITYENLSGVSSKNYVNNMLFLGAYLSYNGNKGSPGGQEWHNDLAQQPYLTNNPTLKKWKLYDDYLGPPKHNYSGDQELDKSSTISLLNNGKSGIGKFHLVSHYDHGGPFGIGVSGVMKGNSLYREDMDALTNGNYLQIMYTTACLPGKFTLDAFAEHYINNLNGGGVAIIANTESVSSTSTGVLQSKKLFQSIYGNLSSNSHLMGVAFANTRDALNDSQRRKVLTLFGDPTMATWSATPETINLTTPTSITIGNSSSNALNVGFNALTEVATITLYKFNILTGYPEIFTTKKIPAGSTSVEFNLNPDTVGELLVQITAKNYLPTTKTINILMPQSHLYVTGYSFVDSNSDGIIEPGENINLTVKVQNSGGTSISNINAVLNGDSNLVSVIQANSSYSPSVNPGETIQLTGFTFKPLVAMGVNEIPDFIELKVNLTASGNYTHLDNFYVDINNTVLNLGRRVLTKNNGAPISSFTINEEVNAKITIGNIGNVSTGALTATLSSDLITSGVIQMITSDSDYPTISINDEKSNQSPFKFKLIKAHSGAMPFKLTLTNSFGKTWLFDFDMNEALPPLITGFDFSSTIDEINLRWNPIANIKGYNIYRSNEINGVYTKVNDQLLIGSAAFSDYNLNKKAEYYYKISVVSLSGNERILEQIVTQDTPSKQGYLAWTSLKTHGAFPISTTGTARSSTTIYDINGDGKKEIFQNVTTANETGRIYGFNESGQEIFNIDGNETTISGFANTEINLWSNSAIGDIDKDGNAEIVTIGRDGNSGAGYMYVHKTVDNNNDNNPDAFWNTPYINTGWRAIKNPVLYDINNDGILEIIIVNENQKIQIFDSNRNPMPGWPIQLPGGGDWSSGHVAVADLDNDGFAEIALGVVYSNGTKGGIYIFNHDGTPFNTNPFKEFTNNERADGGITFADIDNDGEFDLLAMTKIGNQGKIRAYKLNGNPINNTWNSFPSFPLANGAYEGQVMSRISVGDVNNDGNLEVAFLSQDKLYLLDKNGNILPGFPKSIIDSKDSAPILADIDGDNDIEIIVNSGGVINAYNPDGSECIGWRLKSNNGSPFILSPSVDDIDNDGLNEIVVSTSDGTIYAWDTEGTVDRIEWGSYRSNPQNTGTYKKGCALGSDLMIKDGPNDLGIEPNNFTQYMWTSEDIWIRNNNDNGTEHQNPKYNSNNEPNFIKIRVINKGCKPSKGTETLTMNWAKANTNLTYPQNWNGSMINSTGFPLGGQVIGTPVVLPVIQPGQETIITIPWIVPNPNNYLSGSGSENPWHFCVLATILGVSDPLTHPYTANPNIMVKENNNQAWKNLTVVNVNPISTTLNPYPIAVVAVSNGLDASKSYTLELVKDVNETGKAIFKEAEVTVSMDDVLFNAWLRGGKNSSNLQNKSTITENLKLVQGDNATLGNISMNAKEYGLITLNFNFLTQELTDKTKFTYHLIQKDAITGEVMGGESFVIRKNKRLAFEANAGEDIEVIRNQPVVLKAVDIDEPAIYNWYDSNGNLIYTGTDLQIPNAIATNYQLEVISEVDGFKDYDNVNVTLLPSTLDLIAPNPASNSATFKYTLNNVNSAYIRVASYFDNIQHNYVINVNSTQTTIDVSAYNTGAYVVSLICDGQIVNSKTLIKQ